MADIVQKALEKLQKAEAAEVAAMQTLEAVKTELAAKPQDKNLLKKIEGLQKAISAKNAAVLEAKTDYDEAVKKAEETAADTGSTGGSEEKISVRIKHKSTGQFYFRCGLRVKKDFETYSVPESKLVRLKADPYIVFDEAGR